MKMVEISWDYIFGPNGRSEPHFIKPRQYKSPSSAVWVYGTTIGWHGSHGLERSWNLIFTSKLEKLINFMQEPCYDNETNYL